jgi:hypothetical protein
MTQKKYLILIVVVCALVLSLLGGNWSIGLAKPHPSVATIPNDRSGNDKDPEKKPVYREILCKYAPIGPVKSGVITYQSLGESNFPAAIVPVDGSASICVIPVEFAPYRWLMWYYQDTLLVGFSSSGVPEKNPPSGPFQVYFDLSPYQRSVFNTSPDKIGIYFFDVATHTWVNCNATLDAAAGANGRLVCSGSNWGYYSLAQPAPK